MLSVAWADNPPASVTCTVKLLVPKTVGAPEITPVLLFKFSPLGSVPVVIDQV